MPIRMKFTRPAATALGLVVAMGIGAAHAADVIEEPPAPAVPMEVPPVASWTGVYAGITAGYGFAGRSDDETVGNEIDTGLLLHADHEAHGIVHAPLPGGIVGAGARAGLEQVLDVLRPRHAADDCGGEQRKRGGHGTISGTGCGHRPGW